MEGTNSFEKGLHRSNTPQMQPEGSYVDALNWIRNDSGRLVNEELEEIAQTIPDAIQYNIKYNLLGYCPIQDSFIIFFEQQSGGNSYSEIGIFDNTTKQYRRVFNDFFATYKLNFSGEIDSTARINAKGDIIVYFVEKNNVPRRFNITEFERMGSYSSTSYNSIEDWNLQLSFKMPYGEYSLIGGGTLPSGAYSIAMRYVTLDNNKTTFNIPSRFINVPGFTQLDGNNNPIYNDETIGGLPQATSNLSLKIKLKNVDDNYPLVEIVVISYLGLTNTLSIRSLGTYENVLDREIIFSDDSQYVGSAISESELLAMPVFINSAECIEQKDNILILSNTTSKVYDKDFQKVANQIELHWNTELKEVDNRRNMESGAWSGYSNSYSITDFNQAYLGANLKPINGGNQFTETREANFQQSNVYGDPFLLKGFQRGEVYSFSITPIYKDGSVGFSYHIPGKPSDGSKPTRLVEWTSAETYSSLYASTDPNVNLSGFIKHHQMPDYDLTQFIGDQNHIKPLRVEARNIKFTQEQLNNIQGYIIGYQPRVDDLTRRVIDQGFVLPYIERPSRSNYSVDYQPQVLDGRVEVVFRTGWTGSGYTMRSNYNIPKVMYFSADSLLNPNAKSDGTIDSKNYNIQTLGAIQNYILRRYRNNNTLPNVEYNNLYNSVYNSRWGPSYASVYHAILFTKNATGTQGNDVSSFNFFVECNRFIPTPGLRKERITKQILVTAKQQGDPTPAIFPKMGYIRTSQYIHLETNFPIINYREPLILAALNAGQISNVWHRARRNFNYSIDCVAPIYNYVRITNDTSVQYGKLENATYTPCAVKYSDGLSLNNTSILEGDTYISKIFIRKAGRIHDFDETAAGFQIDELIGFYVESKNNYTLRHKDDAKTPFFPKHKLIKVAGDLQIPGDSIMDPLLTADTISYNKQYSALSNLRLTFPKPLFFNESSRFTNRSVYSSQSFESELVDQYRVFPPLNFHDVPRHRGEIKDTFVFNNNFYHHTEYGLWLSYFNPNTTQATSQGEVVLGNAGVFQLPSKLVLDIKGGYMGTFDKSGTNTPFGRVFLDHKQGKIFLLTGEAPVEISDLGLFSYFRDFINTNDKYTMGYDWANKRLLINNISKERAISYYPKTQTWTSFHDFSPKAYFTTNGYSYAFKDNSFYNLNNQADTRKNSYITFVENTSPDSFKRFDRIEMNTMSGGKNTTGSPGFVEPNDYVFLDKSFTHIHAWTDRQNTTELPFSYSHDFNNNFLSNYEVDKVPVNYYRSSFHAELPLDAVVDPYQNIFSTSNTDINADFRSHMKGKFLYTKLSYNDSKPLVLNYIKTFFKPSVA